MRHDPHADARLLLWRRGAPVEEPNIPRGAEREGSGYIATCTNCLARMPLAQFAAHVCAGGARAHAFERADGLASDRLIAPTVTTAAVENAPVPPQIGRT